MESADQTQNEEYIDSLFICKYPLTGPLVSLVYLILATKVLPKYMEKRPAYNLKYVLIVYNIFQVYINVFMILKSFEPGLWTAYWKVHCLPVSTTIKFYNEVAYIGRTYSFVKVLDLVDTAFIILKKKATQLSFLHLFHHSALVTIAFISFADREKIAFPLIILNSFVHAIMYFYYMLASFGVTKWVLRYKKRVTQLQITQFVGGLMFMVYSLIYSCPWGRNSIIIWYITGFILLYQFVKFYYEEYIVKKRKQKS